MALLTDSFLTHRWPGVGRTGGEEFALGHPWGQHAARAKAYDSGAHGLTWVGNPVMRPLGEPSQVVRVYLLLPGHQVPEGKATTRHKPTAVF